MKNAITLFIILFTVSCLFEPTAFAKKKRSGRKKYSTPITHPVILWARTVSESTDNEQRKVAAFKLSHYSQPIFQEEVINTLIKCTKDADVHIKVLCTKAMGRAGNQSKSHEIRKALIDAYKNDPSLRSTLVRVFATRKDSAKEVQELLLDALKTDEDPEDLITVLNYFEHTALPNQMDNFIALFNKTTNIKVKREAIKVLSERGHGQDSVIAVLSQCTEEKDTPLVLNCLAGLKLQARKDAKAIAAVEKTIESSDPDVMLSTLDVIHALPESANSKITKRLLEIIEGNDDAEITEKAVHALGVCGDKSEAVVKTLVAKLSKEEEEGAIITTALVIGKQAREFPELAKDSLTQCATKQASSSAKMACQLALKELERK